MMIDQGQEKGTIEKEEKELITNIFEFNDKLVSEVMTPRTEMFALDIDSNFQDVVEELADYKHSRIPVYAETIDDIQGIVFIKDILVKLSKNEPFKFNELVKTTYFVPESKPIDEVFRELQKKSAIFALFYMIKITFTYDLFPSNIPQVSCIEKSSFKIYEPI